MKRVLTGSEKVLDRTILRLPDDFLLFDSDTELMKLFNCTLRVTQVPDSFPRIVKDRFTTDTNECDLLKDKHDFLDEAKLKECLLNEERKGIQSKLLSESKLSVASIEKLPNSTFVFPNSSKYNLVKRIGFCPRLISKNVYLLISNDVKEKMNNVRSRQLLLKRKCSSLYDGSIVENSYAYKKMNVN